MQLLATMDSTVAIVALPKIQNELSLSDAGRSWVITAYVLTFGGLMLLGGRLGDTIGRKRTFIVGVALFTIASALCGVAWDEATLVIARLLQGVGAAIASPTGLALVATTFPKGPARNAATAVFGAMTGDRVGDGPGGRWRADRGVVAAGVPGERADRAGDDLPGPHRAAGDQPRADEARRRRRRAGHPGLHRRGVRLLDGPGEGLDLVHHHRFGRGGAGRRSSRSPSSSAPPRTPSCRSTCSSTATGWPPSSRSSWPVGVMFTLTVLIGLYVQDIMGYSALRAGVGFIPFVIAMGIGLGRAPRSWCRGSRRGCWSSAAACWCSARCSTARRSNGGMPYFPNLVVPIVVGGIGIGMVVVPLALSAIAGVGFDQIGPTSAIALMLQNLGGPVVLAVIQAVITSRTLYLGGTTGPVKNMNAAQLHALDQGYTYGLLWVAGVAVIVGGVALFIGYTAEQVAHAQEVKDAIDAGEL